MTTRYKSLFLNVLQNKTLIYLGVRLLRNCQCYCQQKKIIKCWSVSMRDGRAALVLML